MHPYSNRGQANNPGGERFHREQDYGGSIRFASSALNHRTHVWPDGPLGRMLIIAPNRVNPALLWSERKGCERNYKSARIGGRSGS